MTNKKLKIYITHSTAFDFKTLLYKPLKSLSDKHVDYQFIFPHETSNNPLSSKEIIKQADLVLAEVSYPSTGQGIELGWAEMLGKPIFCLYTQGAQYSTSLGIITSKFFEYKNSDDLIRQVKLVLANKA